MSALAEAGLLLVTAISAVTDARTGRIPNVLTLPVLLVALVAHGLGGGAAGGIVSLLGVLVCVLPPLLAFRLGGMGGGDVKLLAAIGALVGPGRGLEVQCLAYVVTTAAAIVVLGRRGRLRRLARAVRRAARKRGTVPREETLVAFRLGVPVFVAAVAIVALERL
jgi:prepilin peptidase CpaA